MKKLTIALLLSTCVPAGLSADSSCPDQNSTCTEQCADEHTTCTEECANDLACTEACTKSYECPFSDEGLTWEKAAASNLVRVVMARTSATDDSWVRICEVTQSVVPESNATEIGALQDTLTCTVERSDMSDQEWVAILNNFVARCKTLVVELDKDEQCTGADMTVSVEHQDETKGQEIQEQDLEKENTKEQNTQEETA